MTLRITARECQIRAEKAYRQALRDENQGMSDEHVELVRSCGREWNRRMEWAMKRDGIFDSFRYYIENL